MSPIICALNASSVSGPALLTAVGLAERSGAPLHLATVRPPLAADVYRPPSDPEAATRAVIEVAVDRALGAGACVRLVAAIHAVRADDAAQALVATAADVGATAIVLGTHGRRGLQRFRLGSVAEAVVRDAPCPVLVVPARSDGRVPGPDAPVVVAVDFSEPSARALEAAQWLAWLYGARLEAVHVRVRPALASASTLSPVPLGAMVPVTEADVRTFAAEVGVPDVRAHVEVASDAAAGLAARAEALGAGAVAMGTQGLRGLPHVVFGSVAEASVRRLPCPVLVVR